MAPWNTSGSLFAREKLLTLMNFLFDILALAGTGNILCVGDSIGTLTIRLVVFVACTGVYSRGMGVS